MSGFEFQGVWILGAALMVGITLVSLRIAQRHLIGARLEAAEEKFEWIHNRWTQFLQGTQENFSAQTRIILAAPTALMRRAPDL